MDGYSGQAGIIALEASLPPPKRNLSHGIAGEAMVYLPRGMRDTANALRCQWSLLEDYFLGGNSTLGGRDIISATRCFDPRNAIDLCPEEIEQMRARFGERFNPLVCRPSQAAREQCPRCHWMTNVVCRLLIHAEVGAATLTIGAFCHSVRRDGSIIGCGHFKTLGNEYGTISEVTAKLGVQTGHQHN